MNEPVTELIGRLGAEIATGNYDLKTVNLFKRIRGSLMLLQKITGWA